MKRRWLAARGSFEQLFSSERENARAAVASASDDLVAWLDGIGRPALDRMLSELSKKDDELLVRLACEGGPFATRSRAWIANLRDSAVRAVEVLDRVPPYLSLGAQANRPELPLRRSTGVWATVELLHNWPWRDFFTVRDSLADLKEPIEGVQGVASLLVGHCEPAWLKALKQIRPSVTSVHFEVATNSWIAAHVLSLVLDAREDGIMTIEAHDWAQQLLAPFQVWYAKHGGSEELRPDQNGIEVIEPIRALNTAFVPPNPEVTWMPSSHVRDYCLFLRFLGDQIVGAAHGLTTAAVAVTAEADSTVAQEAQSRNEKGSALIPIQAPSAADCVLDVVWSELGYIVRLGTRNAPDQRVVPVLPVHVIRVLGVVGQIKPDNGPPEDLKKDDPSRFRAWFRAHFKVADGGNPLQLIKGAFVKAWHSSPPKQP